MNQRGSLIIVSGFSGVGKGTIMNDLITRHEGYALSVSATTRSPRIGETEGISYFFVSRARFEEMIRENELIEYACYCDHYYGTPRRFVEEKLSNGTDVLLEIEIQGARKIKAQYPDAVLIFIMPPSADELKTRLTGRGTEPDEVIEARLARACQEAEGIEDYDYIFVNDKVETCSDQIDMLISCIRHRTGNNTEFIETIRKQINQYNKGE